MRMHTPNHAFVHSASEWMICQFTRDKAVDVLGDDRDQFV